MSADCPPAAGGRVFEVRLLGPVRAIRRGREIALGGPRKRAVLALLLLEPGRVVPTGRLMEEVWRGSPGAGQEDGSKPNALQDHDGSRADRRLGVRLALGS